jgi:hypothetical protein
MLQLHLFLMCILLHVKVGTSAENSKQSVFVSGSNAISSYPLQVQSLLIGVIILAVSAEYLVHYLKNIITESFKKVLDAVLNEIMILGVVSIVLFLLEDTRVWDHATIDGESVDVHVVHFIHMALFLVALLFMFSNMSLIILLQRKADKWTQYESYCIDDEISTVKHSKKSIDLESFTKETSKKNIGAEIEKYRNANRTARGSESEMMSQSMQEALIDMDTKLRAYMDWRENASFWDLLWNIRKIMQGNELKHAVQFRHIRSFFLRS